MKKIYWDQEDEISAQKMKNISKSYILYYLNKNIYPKILTSANYGNMKSIIFLDDDIPYDLILDIISLLKNKGFKVKSSFSCSKWHNNIFINMLYFIYWMINFRIPRRSTIWNDSSDKYLIIEW